MACNPDTCRTCSQIRRYREFHDMLPEEVQGNFEEWFNEVYGDLEQAKIDYATSLPEWKEQFDGKENCR